MNMSLLFIFLIMYMFGIISLSLNHNHLMMSLISLEMIILSMFCLFSMYLYSMMSETYMLMIFLTISVCEGVMGLSCLISIIRSHGNDMMLSLSLKTC
uniref:NADH-ubiquinone oxidoreductase chain 4L n=1 Tax=Muda kuroiwae TaxID=2170272 RepID=A0A344ALV2_9HEMI|nr:NADH dehydrogenase subunit 4L [Muda kuroiwae]